MWDKVKQTFPTSQTDKNVQDGNTSLFAKMKGYAFGGYKLCNSGEGSLGGLFKMKNKCNLLITPLLGQHQNQCI